jgi:hypothetical protein
MMQHPAFWMMSDPAENPQFRRCWTLPPLPKQKSPGAPTPGQIFVSNINNITDTAPLIKAQAQALATRLFRKRGVA